MNEKLVAGLNESRRNALVPYYLKYVIPTRNLGTLAVKITTAEDLYEYLLLDPGVSGQIKTSRIAEAVASTQLYLHRCHEQLEPNTNQAAMQAASNSNGYFSRWDTYNKRYANWAGLQRLVHYPASYIDPELRYNKTQLFKELESAINQGRITEERVEQAFTQYVSSLRTVLDIRYDNAYQVESAIEMGVTYFCGSIPGTYGEYYWRRANYTDTGTNGKVRNPAFWSEWLKIDAPLQPIPGTTPSIVFFANRLHVLCVHQFTSGITADKNASTNVIISHELQIATLRPSGQWSILNYPIADSATDVFAAVVRSSVPNSQPELGVFIKTTEEHALYLFSKNMHMTNSPGVGLAMDFIYRNKVFQDYYDIPVRQPLMYVPGTAAATPGVTSNYEFLHSVGDGIAYFDTLVFSEKNKNLVLSARIASNMFFTKTFKIIITMMGWVRYERTVIATSQAKIYEFETQLLFADFCKEHSYSVRLTMSSRVETIPLQRSAPSTPTKLTNLNPGYELWIPTAHKTAGRTQMLYTKPGNKSEYVLTSLAGPLLEQKALEGVQALLSWDVQQTNIDPNGWAGENISRKLSFQGGVGLYTWELFFHVPLLIANRLLAEQRFDEAEFWFKRIFDPAGYRNSSGELQMAGTHTRYWNVRPLQEADTLLTSSAVDTDDPDVIAAADPTHYKLAVFLRGLELLMARGDQLYRQQTRDSLSEAKMWYVQALQMLGKRPVIPLALAWNAPTLEVASSTYNTRLLELEDLVEETSVLLAPGSVRQVDVVSRPFQPPVDTAVLAYWDRFEARLYNLRRHLSIDGQPLSLALFETPTDPRSLQLARQSGDSAGGMQVGVAQALWPQRFMVLLERTRNAVQQVIQFGANLQGVLERRDADALSVLQQTQQGGLLALMGEAHTHNLASLEHTKAGLEGSQATALARQEHFDALFQENISEREQHAMDLRSDAAYIDGTAGVLRLVAGGLNTLPTMAMAGGGIGFAMAGAGWGKLGSVVDASSDVLRLASDIMQGEASKVDISEQYRRRHQDWDLQRDQARREGDVITAQIAALNEQIKMATKQREQTELELAHNDVVLEMLSTRFTGKALFNWQAARLSTLYYQLYDTVSSMCTQTQTSLCWETQDARNYLRPGNWSDQHQGLLAGESLLLSLQQMEAAYLSWDKRALEVRKTASLRSLSPLLIDRVKQLLTPDSPVIVDPDNAQPKVEVAMDGDNNLSMTFTLADMNIQGDYPSSLNLGSSRLIKTLSVSLPALLGPYENVKALLRYQSNSPLADGCKAVAISHGLDDSGQFQLDFNDGKYLPFEGVPIETGTFSLVFPHASSSQKAMLLSLSDVILHISYTIR